MGSKSRFFSIFLQFFQFFGVRKSKICNFSIDLDSKYAVLDSELDVQSNVAERLILEAVATGRGTSAQVSVQVVRLHWK